MARGPWFGARMSKVRITRSTPPVAMIVSRYLFQSCVSASDGGAGAAGAIPGRESGAPWMGICMMRWFEADALVRMSKIRICESLLTALIMLALCGLNWAEYVHLCIGSVVTDCANSGLHIFTQPSHEEERNDSLVMRFQCTEKTSRECSCQDWIGKLFNDMSNSFMEPSPPAVRIWFSCASDQVVSKRASWVSNLSSHQHHRIKWKGEFDEHHFSATTP